MSLILYVDDEKGALNLGKTFLELSGELTVDIALSVKDAEERLGRTEYDAIVSDYQMPGITGIEFLKKLRSQDNKIPFILFTGRGREEVVIEALNNGADFYVQKGDDVETQFVDLRHKVLSAIARRRAEEELRKSEARLHSTLDNMIEGCRIMGFDQRWLYVNDAAARQAHYSKEEMIGKAPYELFPGIENTDLYALMMRSLKERAPAEIEPEVTYPDGSKGLFDVRMSPVPEGIFVLAIDVTERKKAEEQIRRSEALLRGVMTNLPAVVWTTDADGVFTMSEGKGLEALGFEPGEVVGRSALDVNRDHPAAIEGLRKALSGEDSEWQYDVGGAVFQARTTPLMNERGEVTGMLGVGADITELVRAKQDAEEAKSRAELYLDLLTHDIMNYNTAAMGFLDLAQLRLKLEERDKKLITQPLQALSDSSELIANVRDLKRVETGQDRMETIDLSRMLREVKEAFANPPGREIDFVLDLQDSCSVVASPLIRNAFANIVSNAIDHSSCPLTIWIKLRTDRGGGKEIAHISIEDTGPGIADERKDKIFDRVTMGLTKGVSRSLGLYLVKRLMEEHGGQVWVEDRIPCDYTKGARFVILLPSITEK